MRLIDADALLEAMKALSQSKDRVPEEDFYNLLNSAPSIKNSNVIILEKCISQLIHIAAQLAMKQSMPDVEMVEYSVNIPKKSWRSISRMNHRAYEQCNEWAIGLRQIADNMQVAITNAPTVQREGWVSVPIEPTRKMITRAFHLSQKPGTLIKDMYKVMIQAAPTDKE